jgi:hypothetical protein
MPILRRDDGLQFIIHPYREIIKINRAGVLKKKICMLAREHGSNVRISKAAGDNIEVIFSREAGVLLGESVWNFLNKPINLIYCEALFERNYALMVIVKNGEVLLDSKVSYVQIPEELAALSMGSQKYDVYVYGDVPLGQNKGEEKGGYFLIEDTLIKSFTILDESILMRLPMYEMAKLQSLELALTSSIYFKNTGLISIIMGILAIGAVFIGWHVYKSFLVEPIKQQIVAFEKASDPFLSFYSNLSKPYPGEQLVEFVSMDKLMMTLPPGWKNGKISFNGYEYNMEIFSSDGSIIMLKNWMKEHGFEFSFTTDRIPIVVKSKLKPRSNLGVIYPLDDVLAVLIDKVNVILAGMGKVEFKGIESRGSYREANVIIHVNKAFVGVLFMIGKELNRIPVSISSIDMLIVDSLYTGNIKIMVFGD